MGRLVRLYNVDNLTPVQYRFSADLRADFGTLLRFI